MMRRQRELHERMRAHEQPAEEEDLLSDDSAPEVKPRNAFDLLAGDENDAEDGDGDAKDEEDAQEQVRHGQQQHGSYLRQVSLCGKGFEACVKGELQRCCRAGHRARRQFVGYIKEETQEEGACALSP